MSRVRRIEVPNNAPLWAMRLVAVLNQMLSDQASKQLATAQKGDVGQAVTRYIDLSFVAPENIEEAFPIYLAHGLPSRPRDVRIAQATDLTDPNNFNVSAVQPTWVLAADGRIMVRHVCGLIATHSYTLTFVVQA